MSPEVAEDKPYNQSVDVYSFSIVLWELLTGEKPFKDYTAVKHMNLVVLQHERPKLDSAHTRKHNCYTWPPNLIWLIKNGWSHYAVSRPSFTCIIQVLHDIMNGIHTIPTSVLTMNTTATTNSTKRSLFGSVKNNLSTSPCPVPKTLAVDSNNSPQSVRTTTLSPLSKNHSRRTVSDATTTTTTTPTIKSPTLPFVSSPVFLSSRKTHTNNPTTTTTTTAISPLSAGGSKFIKPLPKLSSSSQSTGSTTTTGSRARSWGLGLKRNGDNRHNHHHHHDDIATTPTTTTATLPHSTDILTGQSLVVQVQKKQDDECEC
jgi:Protein tyrosine and serine/threonine kinase